MIDLSKKYRTRRGGEVFGLCEHGMNIYGWEMRLGHAPFGFWWNFDGLTNGVRQDPMDLIEVRKRRQWVLTETDQERHVLPGEWFLSLNGIPTHINDAINHPIKPRKILSFELREVEETELRGNG